jgi:hypothetical protein
MKISKFSLVIGANFGIRENVDGKIFASKGDQ